MNFVFGPVPSRRLGRSLGIDPIPLKTCNWNCVYCQLGRTRPLTNQRRVYTPTADILRELEQVLDTYPAGEIDWITIVGSGEPTLHAEIGFLIRSIKRFTNLPLAVITNGSLLHLPEVRADLSLADAVLPSLDAGTADLFRRLNRPHPGVKYDHLINGLVPFRESYSGKIWLEIMLVKGQNDSQNELQAINEAVMRINPDEIHINSPTRPPAESWVQPTDQNGLQRAISVFGERSKVVCPVQGSFGFLGSEDEIKAILGIISRHPIPDDELQVIFSHWEPSHVRQMFTTLEKGAMIQKIKRNNSWYWVAGEAYFPDSSDH